MPRKPESKPLRPHLSISSTKVLRRSLPTKNLLNSLPSNNLLFKLKMFLLHRPPASAVSSYVTGVTTSSSSIKSPSSDMTTFPRPIDMGSDAYLWRIKDQFLGTRFAECYKGPDFYALCAGEQRRREHMYKKRRSDEWWYLWRAWGRNLRWDILRWLGCRPY